MKSSAYLPIFIRKSWATYCPLPPPILLFLFLLFSKISTFYKWGGSHYDGVPKLSHGYVNNLGNLSLI